MDLRIIDICSGRVSLAGHQHTAFIVVMATFSWMPGQRNALQIDLVEGDIVMKEQWTNRGAM